MYPQSHSVFQLRTFSGVKLVEQQEFLGFGSVLRQCTQQGSISLFILAVNLTLLLKEV